MSGAVRSGAGDALVGRQREQPLDPAASSGCPVGCPGARACASSPAGVSSANSHSWNSRFRSKNCAGTPADRSEPASTAGPSGGLSTESHSGG